MIEAHKISKMILRKYGLNSTQIDKYFLRLNALRKEIHPNTNDLAPPPKEFYITSKDHVPIFIQCWIPKNPKGLFLCQHGNNVHGDLFTPLADEVFIKNWAVISIDNRGHGRSGPIRGYFDKPEQMLPIYNVIIKSWKKKYPETPIHFIGESLGCTLVAMYAQSVWCELAPINSIIFMVPPFKIKGTEYLIRMGNLIKYILYFPIKFFEYLSYRRPFLKLNGFKHVNSYLESFDAYDREDPLINQILSFANIRSLGLLIINFRKYVKKIKISTLILQGTNDDLLDPSGAVKLYDVLESKKKKLIFYKGANHSLFMDKNSQRIYTDIMNWI